MATRIPPSCRTEGDGMEKAENLGSTKQTVNLESRESKECKNPDGNNEKSSSNKLSIKMPGLAVKLVPHAVDKRKKKMFGYLSNKEPKFVPYEPYKAAIRPIVQPSKKTLDQRGIKKKSKDFVTIFRTHRTAVAEKKNEVEVNNEKKNEVSESDWEAKLKVLESEMQTLREENEQLENQLKFQVQVNGELKNLLVAAVGEDMETKVHVLTEDKLHLAQALLHSAESLSSHQERMEWLAGQCEVWRSKFLASSVMVEELARWKASLCQKVNEAHETLSKFLGEQRKIRENVQKTHENLCRLRDNFDLHSKKTNLNFSNVLDVCEENSKLSDSLMFQLLGSKKSDSCPSPCFDHWKKSPAEKAAERILANPNLLQLIGEPDAACNAVMGAAVTLSGQLYLQSHPPKIKCCPQCTGDIKLV